MDSKNNLNAKHETNFCNPCYDPGQEGIKFINLAIAADQAHNIPEAVKYYKLAIFFLTIAFQSKFLSLSPSLIRYLVKS
jgi:hypothetical protein